MLRRVSQPSGPQLWNVEAVDAAGQLIAAWRGVQLHDSGPLPRNAAWPPTLLSVFLERSAADLGLDEGLRVTVSCGQPDDLLSSASRRFRSSLRLAMGGVPAAAGTLDRNSER